MSADNIAQLNKKFSVLLEHFDGGVLIEDETRHIAFVNRKFCQLFSIPLDPEMLIGYDCVKAAADSAGLFSDPKDFLKKTDQILKECAPSHGQQFLMADGRILERDFIPVIENGVLNAQVWLYRDISKYLNIEASLRYRLNFEELITNLSYSFISAKTDNLERVIDSALENVGTFIDADRSYIFQFSNNLRAMSNTYEWCNEGITPEKENLQDLPTSIFPWWMEKLTNFENIALGSLDELPEEASSEKEILEPQGIKSIIVVPIVYSFELLGYLGFDSVRKHRKWNNDSVKLLRVFADILSGTLKRKENEERLLASERKYKSVVDNLTEVIFQTDNEGLWTFLNPAWETITGFTVAESVGQNFLNYIHPEDRDRNYQLFLPLIKKEKTYCRHEIRYLKKDGGFCWVEVFAKLTMDENDQITGTSGTLNDITRRKLLDDEIRKLSKAVESTPTSVILTNLEGKIIFVNRGAVNKGKFKSEDEMLNKNIYEFASTAGIEKLNSEIMPMLQSGAEWHGEMEVITADGTVLPVTMVCSVINDDRNMPQYLLAHFFDISELKKAEQETKNALQKEKELSDMKSRFVSLVSHEFRTPLAAILSSSEILEYYSAKFSQEQKDQHYRKIKASINNLLDILNEISEINRMDSGRVNLKLKRINVKNYISDLIEEVKASYREHAEIIIKEVEQNGEILTDIKLFRQVSLNLVTNAIKYTPRSKKIYIKIENNLDEFILEVEDEGIGIPEKDKPGIFEPFTRSVGVENIKGTGLGLNIARKAAELLGGSISFSSTAGKGSTFRFQLPLNV